MDAPPVAAASHSGSSTNDNPNNISTATSSSDAGDADDADDAYANFVMNSQYMFDYIGTNALDGMPCCIEWTPMDPTQVNEEGALHGLAFVVNAASASNLSQPNAIHRASTFLPLEDSDIDGRAGIRQTKYGKLRPDNNHHVIVPPSRFGMITRARVMPQQPSWTACSFMSPSLLVFDVMSGNQPRYELQGHSEGTGSTAITWSSFLSHRLLSAGHDGSVCIWDLSSTSISSISGQTTTLATTQIFQASKTNPCCYHAAEWSPLDVNLFLTAGSDGATCVWDTRAPGTFGVSMIANANKHIFTAQFNPFESNTISSAGEDGKVYVWDMRSASAPVATLRGHAGVVTRVAWNPHFENILASAGDDSCVRIWDQDLSTNDVSMTVFNSQQPRKRTRPMDKDNNDGDSEGEHNDDDEDENSSQAEEELDPMVIAEKLMQDMEADESADLPDELMFEHRGHRGVVVDIAWNKVDEWTLASVSADKHLQIWQVAASLLFGEGDEDEGGSNEDEDEEDDGDETE